jgi:NAD(P)-dependent dehydrogenase (short-subunit alcohol dehydrogenase family)
MPSYAEDSVLRGTVSIVTGGAAGLGAAVSSELASQGAHIVVVDADAGAAEETVERITTEGGSAEAVVAGVRDPDHLALAFELASAHGPLFSVVSNAGGWDGMTSHYPDSDSADWLAVLDLNLIAPMRVLQLARRYVVAGGAVVHVSSTAAIEDTPYASPEYAVAKAGLIRLTTALADLDDREGPRVGCVVPGWIALERARRELGELDPEDRVSTPHLVPVGDVVDEIVRLIVDPDSGGQVVVLDGESPPHLLGR